MYRVSVIIALFAVFGIISAVPTPTVIDSIDFPTSIKAAVAGLKWTSRSTCDLTGGPCSLNDSKCLAIVALRYINEFRATQGKGPLRQGTVNQYNNAVYHSGVLRAGNWGHQSSPNLGCGSRFSAENIAQNHCGNDPARKCVDAWINSSGHRANLLGDHEATSVGIVFDTDTKIWCTNTFSVNTQYETTGGCAPLTAETESDDDDTPAPASPSPSPASTSPSISSPFSTGTAGPCDSFVRPQFNYGTYSFTAKVVNDECKYCTPSNLCLSAEQSERVNQYFTQSN